MKENTNKNARTSRWIILLIASVMVMTLGADRQAALADSGSKATPGKSAPVQPPRGTLPGEQINATSVSFAFSYQGQLKSGGSGANGNYDFTFSLYDALTGGTLVGTSITKLNQTVANGLFSVTLDFGNSPVLNNGKALWLEIGVKQAGGPTYTTLSPRQALNATPYASGLVPKTTISAPLTNTNLLSVYNTGSDGTGIYAASDTGYALFAEAGDGGSGILGRSLAGEGSGIIGYSYGEGAKAIAGYALSAGGLGVYGEGEHYGVQGVNADGNGAGVYGINDSTGVGVFGRADASAGGTGVYGLGTAYGLYAYTAAGTGLYAHGGTYGVDAISYSEDGTGVKGAAPFGTDAAGVYGTTNDGYGVIGYADGAGYGVYGLGEHNFGVVGEGLSGVSGRALANGNYGVAGLSSNNSTGVYGTSATGWAGYFDGSVNVTGGCCAMAEGYTRIDNPLDPANKYLTQALVQSPDLLTTINGNVTTDAKGDAIVSLPAWFQASNKDFRYQLTIMGEQFAQVRVASKVNNSTFSIKTDKANIEVSWQVTGVRSDPYAAAHPIIAEDTKSAEDQGKYLHPELYNQPETKGIDYDMNPLNRPSNKTPDMEKFQAPETERSTPPVSPQGNK